jgi:hypothetical protein
MVVKKNRTDEQDMKLLNSSIKACISMIAPKLKQSFPDLKNIFKEYPSKEIPNEP